MTAPPLTPTVKIEIILSRSQLKRCVLIATHAGTHIFSAVLTSAADNRCAAIRTGDGWDVEIAGPHGVYRNVEGRSRSWALGEIKDFLETRMDELEYGEPEPNRMDKEVGPSYEEAAENDLC